MPPTQSSSGQIATHIVSAIRSPNHEHPPSYHAHLLSKSDPQRVKNLRNRLIEWYDKVKDDRQMPWRKELKPGTVLSEKERGQRGYEVWVSEIMLQQTQVATVKGYYARWMTRFPTIFDLAKASTEDVNEYWQGLGYYSRASRLLSGAKVVLKDFDGILPDEPVVLEKQVDGIGPYSAGAICSIAFNKSVPMIDGNVHRVLARLTALHANQTAKSTTTFLWSLAAKLVPKERPGAWNQGLMELGATICTPKNAKCEECPLSGSCAAFQEKTAYEAHPTSSHPTISDIEDLCSLCSPFCNIGGAKRRGASISDVKGEEKVAGSGDRCFGFGVGGRGGWREENARGEKACKGFVGGTLGASLGRSTGNQRLDSYHSHPCTSCPPQYPALVPLTTLSSTSTASIASKTSLAPVPHIFSHIKAKYHGVHVVLRSKHLPELQNPAPKKEKVADEGDTKWILSAEVDKANMGLPHKKVFRLAFGGKSRKRKRRDLKEEEEGVLIRKD